MGLEGLSEIRGTHSSLLTRPQSTPLRYNHKFLKQPTASTKVRRTCASLPQCLVRSISRRRCAASRPVKVVAPAPKIKSSQGFQLSARFNMFLRALSNFDTQHAARVNQVQVQLQASSWTLQLLFSGLK